MNVKLKILLIKPVCIQINLIMMQNITRIVAKQILKNNLPLIKKLFNKEQYKNETELSKEVWNLSQQMAMAVKSHEGESL